MAKNKKEMIPEERLAAALVPEEEQPYELPDGWKWVHLGGILDVSKKKMEEFTPDTKYVGLENIEKDTGVIRAVNADGIKSTKNVFEAGDILYGKLRPYLNKHGVVEFSGVCSTDILVFKTSPLMENKLINHYFDLPQVISFAVSHSKGINLPRVNAKDILNICVPLPPLSEQQRLVARIESLFAKLDAAKAKVQAVLDAHETRKAALLHDAFAGKLTAKWREARGVTGDVYQSMPLADVCKSIFDGDHMPPPKSSRGIPFVVISNVNKGKLDFSETRFVPQDYYDKLTDTRKPESGDVLYTLVGTYGIPVLVDTDQAFCFQRHMALLKPKEDVILQRYLWYALQEKDFYREATRIAKGTAQLTVPIKGLRQLTIPMASLPEQQEIVAVLDRLLGREEEVRQSAESVLAAIDSMKQSILARAFRGELGA